MTKILTDDLGVTILSYYVINFTPKFSADICQLISAYTTPYNPKSAFGVSDAMRCFQCHGFDQYVYVCSTCQKGLNNSRTPPVYIVLPELPHMIYLFCTDKCMRQMGMTQKYKWDEKSVYGEMPEKHQPCYPNCCDGVVSLTPNLHAVFCEYDGNDYPSNVTDLIFKLKEGMKIDLDHPIKLCCCRHNQYAPDDDDDSDYSDDD